jgi:hypothetical protein
MAATGTRLADDHYYHMLAATYRIIPTRKESSIAGARASTDLVRISQGLCDTIQMLGKQIGVTLGNMLRPFIGQHDPGM